MKNKKSKARKPGAGKVVPKSTWVKGGVFIAVLTLIFYAQTFRFDFVNWDDFVNIYENENVVQFNVKGIFSEHVIGNYNPLSNLTFAVEYFFVKENAKVYHINNAILHILCTILVFVFMKRLGLSFTVSFLVSLLFGIHPMHVESVAWITERKDVLFGAFYLTSILLYLSWRKSGKNRFYFLSLIIFILSLLSKIQAVALPLSLILIDFWFDKKLTRRTFVNKIPYFVLSLATGLVGIYFLKKQGSLDTGVLYPLAQRLFIGSYSFMVYVIKSVVPWQTSAYYPYPAKLSSIFYLSMIPALMIFFAALAVYKKRPEITFGILFFTVNVAFMLQVVGAGVGFLADRFTYIPYIGLFLLYALLFEHLQEKFPGKKTFFRSVLVIYLGTISYQTLKQIKVWENSETLWTDVIRKQPDAILAYNNLANYYSENEEPDKALANYNISIKIQPHQAKVFKNIGNIFFRQGDYDKALENFDQSLSIDPEYSEVFTNRGAAYAAKGAFEDAIRDFTQVLNENPDNTNALSNRGFACYQTREYEKAIADYTAYLQHKPGDAEIINLVGLCHAKLNDFDAAIREYDAAIRIEPTQAIYYYNRSLAYNSKGDKITAMDDAQQAQKLGMKVDPAYLEMLNRTK